MKHIRKLAGWLLLAEVVVAAVLIVGLLVPLPGKIEFKIVQSGSMEPALPVGSVVAIVPAASYGVGDIITFGYDTKKRIPTTHRIAGIEREGGSVHYRTKGDANEEADNASIAHASVIGKVTASVPRLGFVLDFARSKNGFMFMVVLPAMLIVLDELITIFGVVQGMRRRRESMSGKYENEYGDGGRRERPTNKPARAPLSHAAGINGYSVVLRSV